MWHAAWRRVGRTGAAGRAGRRQRAAGQWACNDWRGALKATPDDPDRMRFTGSYALACGERVWPLAYPDARLYAARLLATCGASRGRLAAACAKAGAEGVKPSFEISSPSLAEVVRDINKFSNNVMAQQLLLTLALQRPGATRATPEAGREALRGWLGERLGESLDGVVIDTARACRARPPVRRTAGARAAGGVVRAGDGRTDGLIAGQRPGRHAASRAVDCRHGPPEDRLAARRGRRGPATCSPPVASVMCWWRSSTTPTPMPRAGARRAGAVDHR